MIKLRMKMLLLLLLVTFSVMAKPPPHANQGAGPGAAPLTLEAAVERIQQRPGVRVLSAREIRHQGGRVYQIRILNRNGKVNRLRIDPETGRKMPSSR